MTGASASTPKARTTNLSTCLFDPREDEDPPLEPLAQAPAPPAEATVPPEPASATPAPQPQPRKPQLVKTTPAQATSAPAKPAPVLRIPTVPPVPTRVLEAFNIDPKDFPTVCPASAENPGSP
jgi:hypothetical protein